MQLFPQHLTEQTEYINNEVKSITRTIYWLSYNECYLMEYNFTHWQDDASETQRDTHSYSSQLIPPVS